MEGVAGHGVDPEAAAGGCPFLSCFLVLPFGARCSSGIDQVRDFSGKDLHFFLLVTADQR